MYRLIIHNKTNNMHLGNRMGDFSFLVDFKNTFACLRFSDVGSWSQIKYLIFFIVL